MSGVPTLNPFWTFCNYFGYGDRCGPIVFRVIRLCEVEKDPLIIAKKNSEKLKLNCKPSFQMLVNALKTEALIHA
jgi:hypothetical protein